MKYRICLQDPAYAATAAPAVPVPDGVEVVSDKSKIPKASDQLNQNGAASKSQRPPPSAKPDNYDEGIQGTLNRGRVS
jgi:hypothetical protein